MRGAVTFAMEACRIYDGALEMPWMPCVAVCLVVTELRLGQLVGGGGGAVGSTTH